MKVIGINGSSRKDGNTAIIIGKVFDELNKESIETELIQLADYEIQPCRGCFACRGRGSCVFTNDGFAEIFSRMVNADGMILGSPVYSADVSAKMKAFLERAGVVVATNPGLLRHKVGASVGCSGASRWRNDHCRYHESFYAQQGDNCCRLDILEYGL